MSPLERDKVHVLLRRDRGWCEVFDASPHPPYPPQNTYATFRNAILEITESVNSCLIRGGIQANLVSEQSAVFNLNFYDFHIKELVSWPKYHLCGLVEQGWIQDCWIGGSSELGGGGVDLCSLNIFSCYSSRKLNNPPNPSGSATGLK